MDFKKLEGVSTFNFGAGKSSGGNRFERRRAGKLISNDIEIMLHSQGMDLSPIQDTSEFQELVQQCYDRGCRTYIERKKHETLRGRLGNESQLCYFVYYHIDPKPQMIVTTESDVAQEFWECCTGQKRKGAVGYEKMENAGMSMQEQMKRMPCTES